MRRGFSQTLLAFVEKRYLRDSENSCTNYRVFVECENLASCFKGHLRTLESMHMRRENGQGLCMRLLRLRKKNLFLRMRIWIFIDVDRRRCAYYIEYISMDRRRRGVCRL